MKKQFVSKKFSLSYAGHLAGFQQEATDPKRLLLNTLLVASEVWEGTGGIKDEAVKAATDNLIAHIKAAAFSERPDLGEYFTEYVQYRDDNFLPFASGEDVDDVHALYADLNADLTDEQIEAGYKKVIRILTTTARMPPKPGVFLPDHSHFHFNPIVDPAAIQKMMSIPGLEPFEADLQALYDALLKCPVQSRGYKEYPITKKNY